MEWIERNKLISISVFLALDVLINCLLFISSFETKNMVFTGEKKFKTCTINNFFGKLLMMTIFIEKGL